MPISSSAATIEKKRLLRVKNKSLTPNSEHPRKTKELLAIGSVLPSNAHKVLQRAHSTLSVDVKQNHAQFDPVVLHAKSDGSIYISRTPKEKEKTPDRLCLDRRGLTRLPMIEGESRLRLLSLQHNLVNNLDDLRQQGFPFLVFLDIYDNQLERLSCLDDLVNLRVLLLGKNRLKKIEGLENLRNLEVIDLHGNQITQVGGLSSLPVLKVLNLAGNQIKCIGASDLEGLQALQELNLRRNRLKKVLGFGDAPSLEKLFLSNNEIHTIEDMRSIAKSTNIKELTIDNNPVSLAGDCISFLVSYLPKLSTLNNMTVTEQVRKAAMAWRRNKELTNSTFMDLTSDVCLNVHREDVISNARTNWELLRTQTRCLSSKSSTLRKSSNLKPDNDIILTSLAKRENRPVNNKIKSVIKGPILPDKKVNVSRTNSQDSSSTGNQGSDYFRLPPILVPIISKLEQTREASVKESISSVGPTVDSSMSSLVSHSSDESSSSSESDEEKYDEKEDDTNAADVDVNIAKNIDELSEKLPAATQVDAKTSSDNNTETSSNLSTNTSVTLSSNIGSDISKCSKTSSKLRRNVKSATNSRRVHSRVTNRAATAKPKKQSPPPMTSVVVPREREQGGDYLIEICGRHLNVYGQGALRFIDKSWCTSKANDVHTVNLNYANFNHIAGVLTKMKPRFPNADHFVFKETNMYCLGQINALAEIQGLTALTIGKEGNPICEKDWEIYAIYRLAHWGLKVINGKDITDEDIEFANKQYESLNDIVLWSLPDELLEPLLVRLQIDVNNSDISPKVWLMSADPALRSVVSKEALQWKKTNLVQEDLLMRQKARAYMTHLLQEMTSTVNKLRLLEDKWPSILQQIVRNTLLDYSHMDIYMKKKLQELK